ncbi:TPA: hypothetical protein ACYENW_005093, partial [Escherichia coli]
ILLIGCITLADLSYCPSIVIIIFLTPLISFNMLCRKQYYIMVEFPDFLGPVMGYPASLHSNRHFRLLRQPVKHLVARKFDLSCGVAMSIDTEKIKIRFSQIYTDGFLFRYGIPRTFVVKVYPSWRN